MSPRIPEGDPELPDELARLPRGRHGLPADFVELNQRERLIASFIALVGESGYGEATIEAVRTGAGVSNRTFYKYFETIEDCYIAAFEKGVELIAPAVAEAFRSQTDWPSAVRAALESALSQFSAYPDLARLLTAEPFVAGQQIAMRHKALIEQLVPYMRQGRELSKSSDALPETTERGLLGAASARIGRHVFSRQEGALTELQPDLLQFLLTPYLGPAEAHRFATA